MSDERKGPANSRTGKNDPTSDTVAPMREKVEENKKIFIERHEYRDATDADFEGRDRNWYDAAAAELASLGYRHLCDVVNETVAKAAGLVVVIRRFASRDGTSTAAIYQFVRESKKGKVDLRVCDVESELSDGSFLTSSNAEAAKVVTMPPQIRGTKYPADTPVRELVALHDAAKRKLLAEQPALRFVEVRTAAEYEAAQHRQEAIKAAFRQGIGYVDPAEIRRIAQQQMPDDPAFAAVAAVSADIARREAQLEKENPAAARLMSLMRAGSDGRSLTEIAQIAADAMLSRQPDVPASKRDEITATMTNMLAAAGNEDPGAAMKNVFTLMGQLQQLEPKEQKEAKRAKFEAAIARAQAEHEQRQAAHRKERLSRGLSAQAGTGNPEPQILIHGLPVEDLDYKDEPRTLGAMVKEIEASKARRDAKTLARLPLGHSRIGGLPDLPPGRAWPTHLGKKIPFVAQLNLADFPGAAHPLLPPRGHLFAFALISNEEEHWPPPASVFVYEGDTPSLVRAAYPADDEIWPDWGDERVYEVLPAAGAPAGDDSDSDSDDSGETLGWLQGSMSEVFGTPGEIADERMEDGDDWINLLAIQSVGSMQWSDSGDLYLLIRRSALEKRDFSHVIAAACSG